MTTIATSTNCWYKALLLLLLFFMSFSWLAQKATGWGLEKMPADLETDFALSALPPHLRVEATVYLLDPGKGFYIAKQGKNGFICFVSRTEWEWEEFREDLATPISYDAEGARTIFPVYLDVAAMRSSGKFTPSQIKDSVISRINRGMYKAPSRSGVSFMLAPIMRVYPDTPENKNIVTMSMPHYMFYAPYLTNSDIGGGSLHEGPIVINAGHAILGERKAPHGYIILPAGEAEKVKIVENEKELVKRLIAYKPYFKPEPVSHP